MNTFKKILDIFIGVTALVLIAGLVLGSSGAGFNFLSIDTLVVFTKIVNYAFPILIGIVCIRFTCGKIVWFILTIVFVALALWIYFDTLGFVAFIHSIFG